MRYVISPSSYVTEPVIIASHGVGKGFNLFFLEELFKSLHTSYAKYGLNYADDLEKSWWSGFLHRIKIPAFQRLAEAEDNVDDVLSYYGDIITRRRVIKNVDKEIKAIVGNTNPREVIIIAHSLGTAVKWDWLHWQTWLDKSKVRLLLLGSPIYLQPAWFLMNRTPPIDTKNIYTFSGTDDPICFWGKRKRNIGNEIVIYKQNHDLNGYMKYLQKYNELLQEPIWKSTDATMDGKY